MILTIEQKKYLIEKVNEKVNLPILGERGEQLLFEKAIDKIERKLEQELPAEILDYMNELSDGFIPGGKGDLKDAMEATVSLLNKEVNIPFMNEQKEEALFRVVVETLFDAMQKGKRLAA